jgi:Na+(H+)/acetate symporter ActP
VFLHDDALGAAASALARLAHVHLAFWCAGTERAGARGVRGHLLVVAADLANEIVEGVLDVDAGLGRGFNELAAELTGERFALC